MKNQLITLIISCIIVFTSCVKQKPINKVVDEALAFSLKQYTLMADVMKDKPDLLPRKQ